MAVALVLLYHGGVTWATGGFLGVEAFFVLSGFLITSLLVSEWLRTSTINLGAFWARRARRLLPALLCVVIAAGVYQHFVGLSHAVPGLSGDGLAALLYYGNWHEIVSAGNYFVQSGPVSPLEHTWSLAIEEQFYLIWPLVLIFVLRLVGRRRRESLSFRRRLLAWLAAGSALFALASATEMAILFDPINSGRVYFGTDTRAEALLAGAALAFATAFLRSRPNSANRKALTPVRARLVDLLGVAGLATLFLATARITGATSGLYNFGFFGIDIAVLAIVASAATPGTLVARLLGFAPLRALGLISYGVYLWHFPLFLWLTPSATGVTGSELLALRIVIVLVVATASFFIVEQPIRRRRIGTRLLAPLAPIGAGLAVGALVLGSGAGMVNLATTVRPPPPEGAAKPNRPIHGVLSRSWYGTDRECTVSLIDTTSYFEASPPSTKYTSDLIKGVASHNTDLGDKARVAFRTCPPKRVLFIGDSIAFTLAFGMLSGEQRYGVELAGDPREACGFNTDGSQLFSGQYVPPPSYCRKEIAHWVADERRFHAEAVVVELGWRDEFEWQVNGRTVGLGDPSFDALVRNGVGNLVQQLGHGGVPILILSVPWAAGLLEPDGSPAPQGSQQRHMLMNNLLWQAAATQSNEVRVLDIDRYISPGNHYDQYVDGQLCRFDGLHFTQFCAQVLQPYVLGEVRQMIADEVRPR